MNECGLRMMFVDAKTNFRLLLPKISEKKEALLFSQDPSAGDCPELRFRKGRTIVKSINQSVSLRCLKMQKQNKKENQQTVSEEMKKKKKKRRRKKKRRMMEEEREENLQVQRKDVGGFRE